MARLLLASLVLGSVVSSVSILSADESTRAVAALESFLHKKREERGAIAEQGFAKVALTKKDAERATELIWNDWLAKLRAERKKELDARSITLGDNTLKFTVKPFGKKPESGWSLFISMHGGGGTAARVNDRQWENQKRLYTLSEGLYVTPRAPTNTWNMWHRSHVDRLFARLIENLIAIEGVNPDRVFILGYSAGGDGVYQLAPRMADRLAGAAMMAGHPNDASPLGLRNIAFALHMGGNDRAYKRNEVARQWKERLEKLRKDDPGGYVHQAVIHPGLGHWMQRKDAVAIPWMAKYTRDPHPDRIVWRQSSVIYEDFYWLRVAKEATTKGAEVRAKLDGQTFEITSTHAKSLTLLLDDSIVDLDQEIVVKSGEKEVFRGLVTRTIEKISANISRRGDAAYGFSAEVVVTLP